MSKRADLEGVMDMQEAIVRIATYLGEMSYEDFREDTRTQDAVIRNIEIVGEAAKGVSELLRVSAEHTRRMERTRYKSAPTAQIAALTRLEYAGACHSAPPPQSTGGLPR